MSMSPGNVCCTPTRVTVMLTTGSASPDTEMVLGYGVATPFPGMVMAPVFWNVWPCAGVHPPSSAAKVAIATHSALACMMPLLLLIALVHKWIVMIALFAAIILYNLRGIEETS